jgi:hypothetical protein
MWPGFQRPCDAQRLRGRLASIIHQVDSAEQSAIAFLREAAAAFPFRLTMC